MLDRRMPAASTDTKNAERSKEVKTYPSADIAVPPNDTVGDPRVIPDDSVGHDDAALQTDTGANLNTGANDDIGAEHGSGVDLGRLYHQLLSLWAFRCHSIPTRCGDYSASVIQDVHAYRSALFGAAQGQG